MLGFNVMAFGTSQYVGVSGVWAQGLLFRNLMLLRNNPGGFLYSGKDTHIDKFYSYTTGVETTLEQVRSDNINGVYKGNSRYYGSVGYNPSFYYWDRLLDDTLDVPAETDVHNNGRLPFTSKDKLNSYLIVKSNTTSIQQENL